VVAQEQLKFHPMQSEKPASLLNSIRVPANPCCCNRLNEQIQSMPLMPWLDFVR
jgi:hypothetical protein